jgi:regulatory protein
MPTVTKISPLSDGKRLRVHFDDGRACSVKAAVVARQHLRVGLSLSALEVEKITADNLRQKCFDRAMRFLAQRLHGRAELAKKLQRDPAGPQVVENVLNELERLGYVDDVRFAAAQAQHSVQRKKRAPQAALAQLLRSGMEPATAEQAIQAAYASTDPLELARELATKQVARLSRLALPVARRRLGAMLQRRGFDAEIILTLLDELFPLP